MATKLSKRSEAAMQVVKAGGRITHRLERQWNGREQFEYRLFDADGCRVKGFAFAALEPLAHVIPRDRDAIYGSAAQRVFRFPEEVPA